MKQLGVTHLLSISAVGSLSERLPPRSLAAPDQIIDRTVARPRTFFDGAIVAHVGIAEPFCPLLRERLAGAAASVGLHVHDGGTYVCIEGPQFSTKAESTLYRSWGADLIGMTAMPEARLAREAEMCCGLLAFATDYDCWRPAPAGRSKDALLAEIIQHVKAATERAVEVLRTTVTELARAPESEPAACSCRSSLALGIWTRRDAISKEVVERYGPLVEKYLAR